MTLGQLLKEQRLRLGRSIDQLSVGTKIHSKILTAIEEDRYSDLPARAFTRGFIVSYCKALKLDSNQVLRDYHDFLESKFSERTDRDRGHQGYVFEGKELEQNRRWLIIGATMVGLFAIAVLLVFKPQNHKRKEKHKDFTEEVAATGSPQPEGVDAGSASPQEPSTVSGDASISPSATPAPSTPSIAATPTATPIAASTPSTKEDKLNKGDDLDVKDVTRKISFEALADVWVRYQIDQKPVTALLLRKGRFLVIKAKEKISVETNNAAALQYRTKSAKFNHLENGRVDIESTGTLTPAEKALGSPLPTVIPASPNAPSASTTPVASSTPTP